MDVLAFVAWIPLSHKDDEVDEHERTGSLTYSDSDM